MNIDHADPKRIAIAIEQFNFGHPVIYNGVLFSLNRNTLEVNSYSDFSDPSRITDEMAKSGIVRSKQVMAALLEIHPEFSALVSAKNKVFYYCCDYRTGAVAVAIEVENEFKWLLHEKG